MQPEYRTHQEIADGIFFLVSKLRLLEKRMPIGLDGAILENLIKYYCEKNRFVYEDNLQNTVQLSSHYDQTDKEKFEQVLSSTDGRMIYAMDLRTKTGELVKTIRDMWQEIANKDVNKAVNLEILAIYDEGKHADWRAYGWNLSDERRILWYPNIEDVNKLFLDENHNFRKNYNISHESLGNISHVQEIKKLI